METQRVILVEDDPGVRRAMVRVLQKNGYEVFPFRDLQDLVHRHYDVFQRYHAIISDYELGGEDTGLDVLKYMFDKIPVRVLHTGAWHLAADDLAARNDAELESVQIVRKGEDIIEYLAITLGLR